MKKSAFGLMTSSVLLLCSCAQYETTPEPKGEVVQYYPKPVVEQDEFTLFSVGRSLSHNAVDIYDPSGTTFSIPPDQPKHISPLTRFPAHPYMLIKDEDVVVYSLFSNHDQILDENLQPPDEIMAPPLPLSNDESQLPP